TSAVGSSDSAFSRATEVPVAAFSLSSAPTTAYPVIFFSILTAMTRVPGCCADRWCVLLCGPKRCLAPTPLPRAGEGVGAGYFFFAALRAPAFFAGAFFAATLRLTVAFLAEALRATFFAAFFTVRLAAAF